MNKFAIIIAGPSGSGKTSVANGLIAKRPELYSLSRSATSRPIREDDKGKDEYVFCTRDEFLSRIENGDMVESTEYSGNLYGTPKSELDRILNEGKYPILVLDLNGVKSFREAKLPYPVYIFYVYEHINVIEQRLYDRDLKNSQTLECFLAFQRRKQANIEDYLNAAEYAPRFDAYVKNSALDECISSLEYCLEMFSSDDKLAENGSKPEGLAVTREEIASLVNELSSQAKEKLD